MKSLPSIAFLAALAAFVLAPLSFETAGSLLFAAGLLGILISDYNYNRTVRAFESRRALVAFAPAASRPPALGLAA